MKKKTQRPIILRKEEDFYDKKDRTEEEISKEKEKWEKIIGNWKSENLTNEQIKIIDLETELLLLKDDYKKLNWKQKQTSLPRYTHRDELYFNLFDGEFIKCSWSEFNWGSEVEWLGTWHDLLRLTKVMTNKNPIAALANRFWKKTKNNKKSKISSKALGKKNYKSANTEKIDAILAEILKESNGGYSDYPLNIL